MTIKKSALLLLAVTSLSSCASMTTGNEQKIAINTSPGGRAICALQNTKGRYVINAPGTVLVTRSASDLQIDCNKPGYSSGQQSVSSTTDRMVFGNSLIPGGIIGTAIDMSDGAAFDYPKALYVNMHAR